MQIFFENICLLEDLALRGTALDGGKKDKA